MNRRSSSWSRLAPVALACVHLGCIGNRPILTCPKQGGPPWSEVKSPHFLLETDLPEENGRAMAVEMETARAALIFLLGAPADEAAVPIEVVVFEREGDFEAGTAQRHFAGFYSGSLRGDVEPRPVIATSGGLNEATKITLQHEIIHQLLRRRTGSLPWWFKEGLAEAYSTVLVDGNELVVGTPPPWSDFWDRHYSVKDLAPRIPKTWLAVDSAPPLDRLLAASTSTVDESGEVQSYYLAACKLVHVLRGDLDPSWAARFSEMLSAVTSGTGGREAFARAYKDVASTTLPGAYTDILLDHHEYLSTVKFSAPPAPAVSARALSDGEVHALWARTSAHDDRRAADAEIARGLAENPDDPAMLFVRASNHLLSPDKPIPAADIEALRRIAPYEPRYVLLDLTSKTRSIANRDLATVDHDERDEILALLGLLQRIAKSPMQRAASLAALLASGHLDEAVTQGEAVVKAEPSCAECFLAYAEALLASDRPAEARDAAERALALLPDNDPGTPYKDVLARAKAALEQTGKPPAPR